jgi:hypothetical protein
VPLRRRDGEHPFSLIRSLRASAQRSTSVLFSFVLCLLIMAGSFAIRQLKTGLRFFKKNYHQTTTPGRFPRGVAV